MLNLLLYCINKLMIVWNNVLTFFKAKYRIIIWELPNGLSKPLNNVGTCEMGQCKLLCKFFTRQHLARCIAVLEYNCTSTKKHTEPFLSVVKVTIFIKAL